MSTDDATPTPTPAGTSTGLDRRSALKKAAVAGAVAWTAPTILSHTAHAAPGEGCTPKCLPAGTPQFVTNPIDTCGGTYVVRFPLQLTGGSVTCPCGGAPIARVLTATTLGALSTTIAGNVVVVSFTRRARGAFRTNISVEATCVDRSGDACESGVCTGAITYTIIGNPGNDCAQTNVVGTNVSITC
jgi:hypothetical protein